jgi:hypothetical protein
MRGGSFASEKRTLANAESMLLVDHDPGQPSEPHGFLDQSVCPDDKLDTARGDSREKLFSRPRLRLRRQERDFMSGAAQELDGLAMMLLGQDFGGHHERHLSPLIHHRPRGEEHDESLSASHVSQEQASHRPPAAQIVEDCLQRFGLVPRKGERSGRFQDFPRRRRCRAIDCFKRVAQAARAGEGSL